MMKPAKDGVGFNASYPLDRTRDRRVFVQRPMRSDVVVIAGIRSQNSAQMRLAQNSDVVHTFSPDRPDQPFGKAIVKSRQLHSYCLCVPKTLSELMTQWN